MAPAMSRLLRFDGGGSCGRMVEVSVCSGAAASEEERGTHLVEMVMAVLVAVPVVPVVRVVAVTVSASVLVAVLVLVPVLGLVNVDVHMMMLVLVMSMRLRGIKSQRQRDEPSDEREAAGGARTSSSTASFSACRRLRCSSSLLRFSRRALAIRRASSARPFSRSSRSRRRRRSVSLAASRSSRSSLPDGRALTLFEPERRCELLGELRRPFSASERSSLSVGGGEDELPRRLDDLPRPSRSLPLLVSYRWERRLPLPRSSLDERERAGARAGLGEALRASLDPDGDGGGEGEGERLLRELLRERERCRGASDAADVPESESTAVEAWERRESELDERREERERLRAMLP